MPSTNTHLPRILCFHGGGSSAAIFRIQSRKIQYALRHHFRFIFVDGPFESTAGPGILPIFEGAGPYYRWHCDSSAVSVFDITESEIATERRIVREKLDRVLGGDGGAPFVGVMGFSQGTRVATGLLLLLEQLRRQGSMDLPPLSFAVLICGTYPPLPLADDPSPLADQALVPVVYGPNSPEGSRSLSSSPRRNSEASSTSSEPEPAVSPVNASSPPASLADCGKASGTKSRRLSIRSIHAHGLQDPWLLEGRDLLTNCYGPACATLLEFQGGHHIPSAQKDIDKLARAILGAYEAANPLGCPM